MCLKKQLKENVDKNCREEEISAWNPNLPLISISNGSVREFFLLFLCLDETSSSSAFQQVFLTYNRTHKKPSDIYPNVGVHFLWNQLVLMAYLFLWGGGGRFTKGERKHLPV